MTKEMFSNDKAFLRSSKASLSVENGTARIVDLFAGCGGLTLGVEEACRQLGLKLDIRMVSELDPLASATYAKNFPVALERCSADIRMSFDRSPGRSLSVSESEVKRRVGAKLDLIVGGPPCQGHSSLNNHTRGDDPKNALYLSMVRAAEILTPRAMIVENVPAIERDKRRVVERATRELERIGYRVTTRIVSLATVGVPQLRKRHVLVASFDSEMDLDDTLASAAVPVRDIRWAIGDLIRTSGGELDEPAILSEANQRRAEYLLRYNKFDLPNELRPPCQRGNHRYKSMYGRLAWDQPAQTITTGFGSPGQGRYLHPELPRTITPHEAARLQFFPDWFDFSPIGGRRALSRAIGNAVPPKLSFVLAHRLLGDMLIPLKSKVAPNRVLRVAATAAPSFERRRGR